MFQVTRFQLDWAFWRHLCTF